MPCPFSNKPRPETGNAIVVTRIVPSGTADLDGRLQIEDIILSVDNVRLPCLSLGRKGKRQTQSEMTQNKKPGKGRETER